MEKKGGHSPLLCDKFSRFLENNSFVNFKLVLIYMSIEGRLK
jgi:hypothetical protein